MPHCFDTIWQLQRQLSYGRGDRPHTTGTPSNRSLLGTSGESDTASCSQGSNKVPLGVFVAALDDCNAPLSHAEAVALGHLLVREKVPSSSTTATGKRTTPRHRGNQKKTSMDDSTVSSVDEACAVVDISLLSGIADGHYVSAAL